MTDRLTRRRFMQSTGAVAAGLIGGRLVGPIRALEAAQEARAAGKKPPNVLMIISDDLNDWCGCYGGHGQARKPNIDRLAGRGVRFDCAQVQMPWCGPSRASLLTGLLPTSTGIFRNDPCQLANYPGTKDAVKLPRCFSKAGYETLGVGKIYHRTSAVDYSSEFDRYAGESLGCGRFGPVPPKRIHWREGGKLLDWGAYPQRDEQMADHKMADWAIDQLNKRKGATGKPWFMTVGFYRPHCPHTVPPRWLEMFPLDSLKMPEIKRDDLQDVPAEWRESRYIQKRRREVAALRGKGLLPSLVQAYLACVAFLDYEVGRVLNALEANGQTEDTLVVFFGDHGYHLGEKTVWMKRTLWEEATRTPMILAGPGVAKGKNCTRSVGLVDVYPTRADRCNLPAPENLQGASLSPLLKNPAARWDRRRPRSSRARTGRCVRSVSGIRGMPMGERSFTITPTMPANGRTWPVRTLGPTRWPATDNTWRSCWPRLEATRTTRADCGVGPGLGH